MIEEPRAVPGSIDWTGLLAPPSTAEWFVLALARLICIATVIGMFAFVDAPRLALIAILALRVYVAYFELLLPGTLAYLFVLWRWTRRLPASRARRIAIVVSPALAVSWLVLALVRLGDVARLDLWWFLTVPVQVVLLASFVFGYTVPLPQRPLVELDDDPDHVLVPRGRLLHVGRHG